MKFLTLLLALALCGAAPALAATGDKWIGLQLGASAPTGEFTHSVKTGFEGGAELSYFETDADRIGLDVVYHSWKQSDDLTVATGTFSVPGSEYQTNMIQVTGHVRHDIRNLGMFRPYAKVGCGVYFVRTRFVTSLHSTDFDMRPHFGLVTGAGVSLMITPMFDIGVGATYHVIQGDPAASLFTAGLDLSVGQVSR